MFSQIGLSSLLFIIIIGVFLIKKQFKLNKRQIKYLISAVIGLFLLQALFIWFVLPSKSLLNYLATNIVIGLLGVLLVWGLSYIEEVVVIKNKQVKWLVYLIGGAVALVVLYSVSFGYDIYSKKQVYQTLNLVQGTDTPELGKEDTPVTIPPKTVRNKMQKSLNQFENQQFYNLGDLQVQKVNDEVVYIAPLEFKGFWRWLKAGASEGYLKMSATDVYAQPEAIKEEMSYIPSAYFLKDVKRKIYFATATYKTMGEPQLEVDDEGKAYYVQTLYQARGLSENPNYQKMKVAVLDTVTGRVSLYALDEVPAFIDAPISPEMASEMNSVYGKYENGWLNSRLSKKGVKIATELGTEENVTPIFNENGEMLYFTDFTSPSSSDASAIGYSYINARTGELTYYSKKNMMDSEGLIKLVDLVYPEKKFEGNMPLLYNIDGVPTWVVSMLDKNGIFKMIAYVNATDSDILAMEDTVSLSLQSYRLKLSEKQLNVSATDQTKEETVTGIVKRVSAPISTNEGLVIKFLLDDQKIYTVTESNYPNALFLEKEDQVSFKAKLVDEHVQGYVSEFVISTLE